MATTSERCLDIATVVMPERNAPLGEAVVRKVLAAPALYAAQATSLVGVVAHAAVAALSFPCSLGGNIGAKTCYQTHVIMMKDEVDTFVSATAGLFKNLIQW